MRILLVEDEPETAAMLAKGLRECAYAVDVAAEGSEALELLASSDVDLVILDVMLPGRSGLDVCRDLRASGLVMPVLMLTARDGVEDRVQGLDAGADDYLCKPFSLDELLARVRALLRRAPALRPSVIQIADLALDSRTRRVSRAGTRIDLTAKEYALLEFLATRPDEIVGRAEIAEHVWDGGFDAFSNRIEVYIQRLRRKVDDGYPVKLIHTHRGAGYALSASEAERAS